MANEKPFTYQYIFDRWADGLKVLAAGHSAGLVASAAAFQFFGAKSEIASSVKWPAVCFGVGILAFSLAYFLLTVLPLVIDRFVAKSSVSYDDFTSPVAFSRQRRRQSEAVRSSCPQLYLFFLVLCAWPWLSAPPHCQALTVAERASNRARDVTPRRARISDRT